MRKILLILLIMATAFSFAAAQVTFDSLEDDFKDFSGELASNLPFASTIGLNWSSAFTGGFPRFGVGVTMGAVMMPMASFDMVAEGIGFELPSEIEGIGLGLPIPAYTVDARLGIPILPIDVGVKVGIIDPEWTSFLPFGVDYLLAGADVRWSLIDQGLIFPNVSVGVGYNYLKGGVVIRDVIDGQTVTIPGSPGGVSSLGFSGADLVYEWNTQVLDVKAQVSKSLLIFTPAIGVGYSYGFSTAGGGMDSEITVNGTSATLTPSQISAVESATGMDLEGSSLRILSEISGGTLRAWAGVSVNITLLKLDVSALYNVLENQWGATFNARIQL